MPRSRPFLWAFAATLACACTDATGPATTRPGVHVLAGGSQSDTVLSLLPRALMVEVRDSSGALATGAVVQFQSVLDTFNYRLAVSALATSSFGPSVVEGTDSKGQAGVLVTLGTLAGPARVAVTVPALNYTDTVTFTVTPGNAARIVSHPADTAVILGASFQMHAAVTDRFGNPRSDAITYSALDATVSATSGGLITARSGGIGRIVILAGSFTDTVNVGVIPQATIAGSIAGGIEIVNLDGSGATPISFQTGTFSGRFPHWISATAIAAADGQYYAKLLNVNVTAGTAQQLVDSTQTALEVFPQVSRDGSWIYFGGLPLGAPTSEILIWRVHPDGTGLGQVSPASTNGFGDSFPSPSPDGSKVAVGTTRNAGGWQLAVIDVATSQETILSIAGLAPRWAPSGDSIAYLSAAGSEIWLVSSGGGGARRVSPPGHQYQVGIDWSPDRAYIIGFSNYGLELVNVATGAWMVLPNPTGLTQPAFKP